MTKDHKFQFIFNGVQVENDCNVLVVFYYDLEFIRV